MGWAAGPVIPWASHQTLGQSSYLWTVIPWESHNPGPVIPWDSQYTLGQSYPGQSSYPGGVIPCEVIPWEGTPWASLCNTIEWTGGTGLWLPIDVIVPITVDCYCS